MSKFKFIVIPSLILTFIFATPLVAQAKGGGHASAGGHASHASAGGHASHASAGRSISHGTSTGHGTETSTHSASLSRSTVRSVGNLSTAHAFDSSMSRGGRLDYTHSASNFWLYYWVFSSNWSSSQRQQAQSAGLTSDNVKALYQNNKHVTIDDNGKKYVVFVSPAQYDKINVGDKLTLQNNVLQVNGHTLPVK